jgi:hypothetical protein
MASKGTKTGPRGSETYELLPHRTSIDQLNGTSTLQPFEYDDGQLLSHRRSRDSLSHSGGGLRRDEVLGLLTRSRLDLRKNSRFAGGLGIALELVTQSTPSLLCAVVGSVMTGFVFNQVQSWTAFVKIGELFILVPVLLNLKGCLEMNLASRLSTSVLPPDINGSFRRISGN